MKKASHSSPLKKRRPSGAYSGRSTSLTRTSPCVWEKHQQPKISTRTSGKSRSLRIQNEPPGILLLWHVQTWHIFKAASTEGSTHQLRGTHQGRTTRGVVGHGGKASPVICCIGERPCPMQLPKYHRAASRLLRKGIQARLAYYPKLVSSGSQVSSYLLWWALIFSLARRRR